MIHVVLRRRGVTPSYVPPISIVLAEQRKRYIQGLGGFRTGQDQQWIERFAAAAATAGRLASDYVDAVQQLADDWRIRLAGLPHAPRADAAAWAVIEALPAYPIITGPVAAAATGRSKPQICQALSQLEDAGVLEPLSKGRRNRSWEATGLLDLLARLESGQRP